MTKKKTNDKQKDLNFKERRHVKHEFTAVEIHEMSVQLANKTKEFGSLTEEKKTVASGFASRLNEIKTVCNRLSDQVSNGYELREAEFTVEYHKPEKGMKLLTSIDGTADPISEKMQQWDYNLFSQQFDVSDDEKKSLTDASQGDDPVTTAIIAEPVSDEEKAKNLFKHEPINTDDQVNGQEKKKSTKKK